MKNYPLPREHKILSSSPNITSISPPPSHPPTLDSGPKQNYPSIRRYPDHHYLKSFQQNNSIHRPASQVPRSCLWSRQNWRVLPRRNWRGQLSTGWMDWSIQHAWPFLEKCLTLPGQEHWRSSFYQILKEWVWTTLTGSTSQDDGKGGGRRGRCVSEK